MSTALASLQEEIKAQLDASQNAVSASAPKISVRNGAFSLPDGTTSQGPLNLVILDFRWIYKFYSKPYNPQNIELPDCYAVGKIPTELKPASSIKKPISKECTDCPNNQWGSASNGKAKACRNTIRAAVIPADFSEETPVWTIDFAPTSITNFSNFVAALRDMHGRIPMQDIAELSLAQGPTATVIHIKSLGPHEHLETAFTLQQKSTSILDHPFD